MTSGAFRIGIDEAGRGPVIGPLVVAAVWLEPGCARALRRAGVRDSKTFGCGPEARAERNRLADLIRRRALHVEVEAVAAVDVDYRVLRGELNVLERDVAFRLLQGGPSGGRIIADGQLFAPLAARVPQLRSASKADGRFIAVGAASIIAKDLRDRLFLAWAAQQGELAELAEHGMGYVNSATRTFLSAYVTRYGRFPHDTRLSWDWAALRELLGRDPRDDLPAGMLPQLSLL